MQNRFVGGPDNGAQAATVDDASAVPTRISSGVNNTGLLVRTWGAVTQVGADYLYIDDGSGLNDGTSDVETPSRGLRVVCDPAGYALGDFVIVTGISSCFETPDGIIAKQILVRRSSDIAACSRTAPAALSLAAAESLRLGARVQTNGLLVSASYAQMGDCIYVQDPDRYSGIRVCSDSPESLGQEVSALGILHLNANGEVELSNAQVTRLAGSDDVRPVGMNLGSLGGGQHGLQPGVADGVGVNNIGALVRCWGKFTYLDNHTFNIDDGRFTTKCMAPSGVSLDRNWKNVLVTGISACERIGTEIRRLVRIRTQSDIQAY